MIHGGRLLSQQADYPEVTVGSSDFTGKQEASIPLKLVPIGIA